MIASSRPTDARDSGTDRGLEQILLKQIEYRGKTFHELDTAAVIERKPEWVLVDEMAHTNVPGTVHAKRWQSIDEIRNAGINVISTLNIQHLDSLNDTVFELTGVRVRETIRIPSSGSGRGGVGGPDPGCRNQSVRRGDILPRRKISQALANFFKKGNIVALRELALRMTADEWTYSCISTCRTPHGAGQARARAYRRGGRAPSALKKLVRRG